MKRITPFVFVLFSLLFFTCPETLAEKDWNVILVPIRSMHIAPPGGVVPKRPPAYFPHPEHFDYSCKTCHHTWDSYTPIRSCATADCHIDIQSPKKNDPTSPAAKTSIKYYKTAYHRLCIGCHKQLRTDNRELEKSRRTSKEKIVKAGPTSCKGCHRKE